MGVLSIFREFAAYHEPGPKSSENSVEAPANRRSSYTEYLHVVQVPDLFLPDYTCPSASRDAAIIGSTEFFAPLPHSAHQWPASSIISLDTSQLSPCHRFVSWFLLRTRCCLLVFRRLSPGCYPYVGPVLKRFIAGCHAEVHLFPPAPKLSAYVRWERGEMPRPARYRASPDPQRVCAFHGPPSNTFCRTSSSSFTYAGIPRRFMLFICGRSRLTSTLRNGFGIPDPAPVPGNVEEAYGAACLRSLVRFALNTVICLFFLF